MTVTIHNLFKNTDFDLIFLADWWFNSSSLLKTINNLGHTFCIRIKDNLKIKYIPKSENHLIYAYPSDFFVYEYYSTYYNDVIFFPNDKQKSITLNVAVSKKHDVSES